MEPALLQQEIETEENREQRAQEAFLKIQQSLRCSRNPSFSSQQVSYLEDLLANNLLSIVMYSKTGRECAACFGVVDRVLARVRELRAEP